MSNVWGRIRKEFRKTLPAFIFFFISFHLSLHIKNIFMREYGLPITPYAVATIGAIFVAKAALIVNNIKPLNQYPKRPLICNIVLKTIAFGLLAMLFKFIEEWIRLSFKYGSMSAGGAHMVGDTIWPIFWANQVWMYMLLFFYCTAAELVTVIGKDEVKEILFGKKRSCSCDGK